MRHTDMFPAKWGTFETFQGHRIFNLNCNCSNFLLFKFLNFNFQGLHLKSQIFKYEISNILICNFNFQFPTVEPSSLNQKELSAERKLQRNVRSSSYLALKRKKVRGGSPSKITNPSRVPLISPPDERTDNSFRESGAVEA